MAQSNEHNAAICQKRQQKDIMKLMVSNFKVEVNKETKQTVQVEFNGPKDSLYENGRWKINVILPSQYPYKSPSIGFENKIYHPNIDFQSGTVCLDVINQTWSPMFELINIFDMFLPQLLLYPNPKDPLNPDAAAVMTNSKDKFEKLVKEYVLKYASDHLTNVKKDSEEEQLQLKKTFSVSSQGNNHQIINFQNIQYYNNSTFQKYQNRPHSQSQNDFIFYSPGKIIRKVSEQIYSLTPNANIQKDLQNEQKFNSNNFNLDIEIQINDNEEEEEQIMLEEIEDQLSNKSELSDLSQTSKISLEKSSF